MTADRESAPTAALPAPAATVAPLTPRLPPGADPDAVRDWFEFETIVDLRAPALTFAAAEAAAADYRRAARAENTRRAYRSAVAAFTEWCAAHRQTALPASPDTVSAFLAAEAGRGLAVNTLRLRHAALRYLHLLAGYPPPTASPLVSATFAGIRRPPPAVAQKDRAGARPAARRRAADPRHLAQGSGADDADPPDTPSPVLEPLQLTPLDRKEFEFSDLDDWMREAGQVIHRSQALLDRIAEEHATGHRGDTTWDRPHNWRIAAKALAVTRRHRACAVKFRCRLRLQNPKAGKPENG
jgi:hypothetical protein